MQAIREQLVPKVHALCGSDRRPGTGSVLPASAPTRTPAATAPPRPRPLRPRPLRPVPRVDAVVIGVSTGGPNALAGIVPKLPHDLCVPVLVVQHMPPMFTRLLAERLDDHTPLTVREAGPGAEVRAGTILLAPGDHHLEVEPVGTGVRAILGKGAPENSCRPSVDVLFRSAARVYGQHTLAVVLTGMGVDGRSGSEHVHEAGGQVIVQDEATSVVWGMPGAVVDAGVADEVLPLHAVADAIRERTVCQARPQEVRA